MPEAANNEPMKKRGRPKEPESDIRASRQVPMKVDPRLLPLLNSLADWLNDYQYRVLMKIVCREVRRQGIPLPPYKMELLEALEQGLGIDPKDVNKLLRPTPPEQPREE